MHGNVVHLQDTGTKSHFLVILEEVRDEDTAGPRSICRVTDIMLTSGDFDVSREECDLAAHIKFKRLLCRFIGTEVETLQRVLT